MTGNIWEVHYYEIKGVLNTKPAKDGPKHKGKKNPVVSNKFIEAQWDYEQRKISTWVFCSLYLVSIKLGWMRLWAKSIFQWQSNTKKWKEIEKDWNALQHNQYI